MGSDRILIRQAGPEQEKFHCVARDELLPALRGSPLLHRLRELVLDRLDPQPDGGEGPLSSGAPDRDPAVGTRNPATSANR